MSLIVVIVLVAWAIGLVVLVAFAYGSARRKRGLESAEQVAPTLETSAPDATRDREAKRA